MIAMYLLHAYKILLIISHANCGCSEGSKIPSTVYNIIVIVMILIVNADNIEIANVETLH